MPKVPGRLPRRGPGGVAAAALLICNGQLFLEGGALVHLHWTRRLIAYALLVIVVIAVAKTQQQEARSVRRSSP